MQPCLCVSAVWVVLLGRTEPWGGDDQEERGGHVLANAQRHAASLEDSEGDLSLSLSLKETLGIQLWLKGQAADLRKTKQPGFLSVINNSMNHSVLKESRKNKFNG